MKLTFIGHSAFYLEHAGDAVLIDPFITGNPVATLDAEAFEPQTILLTHAHNDHVGDTVDIANRTGATVVTILELGDWLSSQGVEDVVAANHGGTVGFQGGSVKFTPAWHSSSFNTSDGAVAAGVPAGLVVRFGGTTCYFAGDTALFSDMKLIGEEGLDIAVLPIGDHFTMGPDDALRAVNFLKSGVVIPCHYNTFPPIAQDGNRFKTLVEQSTSSTCTVLEPGEALELL